MREVREVWEVVCASAKYCAVSSSQSLAAWFWFELSSDRMYTTGQVRANATNPNTIHGIHEGMRLPTGAAPSVHRTKVSS